jgi:hypothetical protein
MCNPYVLNYLTGSANFLRVTCPHVIVKGIATLMVIQNSVTYKRPRITSVRDSYVITSAAKQSLCFLSGAGFPPEADCPYPIVATLK